MFLRTRLNAGKLVSSVEPGRLVTRLNQGKLSVQMQSIAADGTDPAALAVAAFKSRVEADGGALESEACITARVQLLITLGLWDSASWVLAPHGYKTSKLHTIVPTSGAGDLAFSRSTAGYRFGPLSLVEQMGINVPRLDSTRSTCPSLLLELQRTNSLLQSNTFTNAIWTKVGTTLTAAAAIAPDGTLTATRVNETVTTPGHYVRQDFTKVTGSETQTFAVYVKKLNQDWIFLQGASSSSFFAVYFNLTTGLFGTTSVSGYTVQSTRAVDAGNGWYRVEISYTANAGITSCLVLVSSTLGDNLGSAHVGDTANGFYIWGAQAERTVAYPTSYISTTAATATRTADSPAVLTDATLIGQAEGTIFLECSVLDNTTSKFFSLTDGTTNERVSISLGVNTIAADVRDGGVAQASFSTAAVPATFYKIALVYSLNYVALFVNGVRIGQDLLATVPACNKISFTSDGVSALPFLGWIRCAAIWKTALTDVQALALTT
jgi:hypothetical protein